MCSDLLGSPIWQHQARATSGTQSRYYVLMQAANHSWVSQLDLSFALELQEWFGDGAWTIWNLITNLGSAPAFMLIIGLTFWLGHPKLGLRLLMAMLFTAIVVDLLKVLIAQPRPYYVFSELNAWRNTMGFGMPSGHTAGAATLWLILSATVKKTWFSIAAVTMILAIGMSRIYFGVHSPTQVIAGLAVGVLVAFTFHTLVDQWYARQSIRSMIAGGFASTTILFGLQFLIMSELAASFTTPDLWQSRYEEATQFEAQRLGVGANFETLKLFNAFNLSQLGLIAGGWLVMILFRFSNTATAFDSSSFNPSESQDSINQPTRSWSQALIACVAGVLMITICLPLLHLTSDYFFIGFILWMLMPSLVTLLPCLAAKKATLDTAP